MWQFTSVKPKPRLFQSMLGIAFSSLSNDNYITTSLHRLIHTTSLSAIEESKLPHRFVSRIADGVGERGQPRREVGVLDIDALRDVEFDRREVPYAANAGGDELVGA